jgi:hypothetical protein
VSEGSQTIVVEEDGPPDGGPPDDGMGDPPDDGTTAPPDDGKTDPPDDGGTDGPTDITDATFANRDGNCASYVGEYEATVTAAGQGMNFTSRVEISASGGDCTLSTNGIPNHDVNSSTFATPLSEVDESYTIPKSPSAAASPTPLTLEFDNAIFLNGAKLDLLAAACYGVGTQPLGQETIGCFQSGTPWRYDPAFSGSNFETDSHNAHTQPDGAYHYHGDPLAMYDLSGSAASIVIGFAADGFPIYGPYIDDDGTIRRVESGYELRSGDRVSQAGEGSFPNGNYDGTYVYDYEFTGNGDLDPCNGMTQDGVYGYYVTDTYPYVIACFTGTPDESFRKAMP